MKRIATVLSGDGMRARILRGTIMSFGERGGSMIIRLASNLILTRLLFPEAFGLMALMYVFITALNMFSDVGINASIARSSRGDDEDFLNTAWTIQILRGFALWIGACALAWPVSWFYDDPRIMTMLPVVGLTAIISGLLSTNIASALRHIRLKQLAILNLITQFLSVCITIFLAWIWPSVWALILGTSSMSLFRAIGSHIFLPGIRNKIRWDPESASELFGFGKFVFVSTMATFFRSQSDKLMLGRLVTLSDLAIYNIAFFIATVPKMLAAIFVDRIMLPVYRELKPDADKENRKKIARVRYPLTAGLLTMTGTLAITGGWLIGFMYDARYEGAAPMLVLMAIASFPELIVASYPRLLLAEGDSKSFSRLSIISAISTIVGIPTLFYFWGMFGIVVVPALTTASIYYMQFAMLKKYSGEDPRHDLVFLLYSAFLAALAFYINWPAISSFYHASSEAAPFRTGTWLPGA